MNNPSIVVQRTMPIEPRPIRCGDPEYPDRVMDICLRLQLPPLPPDGDLGYRQWTATLPTLAQPHYALDYHSRGRLPCEHFRGPVVSEFQNDDRLTTSNLIDLQTKESWWDNRIRANLYGHSLVQYELAGFSLQGLTGCCQQDDWMAAPSTKEPPDKIDEETQHGFPPPPSPLTSTHRLSQCLTCSHCDICERGLWAREPDDAGPISCPFPYDTTVTELRTSGTPDVICGPFLSDSSSSSSSSSSSCSSLTSKTTITDARPTDTPPCGERIHKCDHLGCPKRFSRKEELTRHRKTHSNDRSFECKVCKRRFNRKDHMTKHQATHEDVGTRRRYVCREPGCERRYTRSDALSRHRSSAHALTTTHVPLSVPFGLARANRPMMS